MINASKGILVLGLGNEILMDDGIGPKLALELGNLLDNPGITYETAAVGGMELIEMIRDYNHVIIIDAIKTRDGIPGSVYYLTPSSFKETLHISNLHDISFITALKMAKEIGIRITDKIDIVAIEIIEDRVFGEEFTLPVQNKFHEIKKEVLHTVKSLIYN